jgi:flagellar biosynthesis/type III secretory pathway protein FliH
VGLIKSANLPTSIAPFSMSDIEQQAKLILLRARKAAEQLLAAAQAEAEALKQQATAQGLADGRQQGIALGLEQGRQIGQQQAFNELKPQLIAAHHAMTQAVAQIEQQRHQIAADGLREVVELAAAISRRVTKRQGMIDPQVLVENLADAMTLVSHASDLRIAVHPLQLTTIREELPRLQLTWPQLKHAELIEDATLAMGGCRVITAAGEIDADLNAQLDRVIDAVLPSATPSQGTPGEGTRSE